MNEGSGYKPVACDFHDRLEAYATLRRRVRIAFAAAPGAARTGNGADAAGAGSDGVEQREGRIEDVYTTDRKAEFLRMDNGAEIRLDRILSVDEAA